MHNQSSPIYALSKMSPDEPQRLGLAAQKFIECEFQFLDQYLFPGQRIADIGCGTGEITREIAARYPTSQVLGLDVDPVSLQKSREASQEFKNLDFQPWKLGSNEPIPGEAFDLIFMRLVLLHNPEPKKMIASLSQHLSPGGRLYLIDADDRDTVFSPTYSWQSEVLTLMQTVHSQLGGSRHLGRDLKGLLQEAGFSDTETFSAAYSNVDIDRKECQQMFLPVMKFYLDLAEDQGIDTGALYEKTHNFLEDPTSEMTVYYWHASGVLK